MPPRRVLGYLDFGIMADVPPPTKATPGSGPTTLPSLFTCPTCVSDPIDCSSSPRQFAFNCGDVYPTTDSIYAPVMAIFNLQMCGWSETILATGFALEQISPYIRRLYCGKVHGTCFKSELS